MAEFWITLIASIIGAGTGAFLGYLGASKISKRQYEKRQRDNKINTLQETLFLLESLKKEIYHNIELLQEANKEISSDMIIFYHMDINVWDASKESRINLIKNQRLLNDLNNFYYEIQHLQRKIDAQFEMFYTSKYIVIEDKKIKHIRKIPNDIPERVRIIHNTILAHIPRILGSGSKLSTSVVNDWVTVKNKLDKLKS